VGSHALRFDRLGGEGQEVVVAVLEHVRHLVASAFPRSGEREPT
jgi:hypothetical protein